MKNKDSQRKKFLRKNNIYKITSRYKFIIIISYNEEISFSYKDNFFNLKI